MLRAKQLLNRHPENRGKLNGDIEGWIDSTIFQRADELLTDAGQSGEVGLGESSRSSNATKRCITHDRVIYSRLYYRRQAFFNAI